MMHFENEGRHIIPNDDDKDVMDKRNLRNGKEMSQDSSPIRTKASRSDDISCIRESDLSTMRRIVNPSMSMRSSYPPNNYTSTSFGDESVNNDHYLNSVGRGTSNSRRMAMGRGQRFTGARFPQSHSCRPLAQQRSGTRNNNSNSNHNNSSSPLNILRYNRYMSHHIGSCIIMHQVRMVHEGLYQLDKHRIKQQVQSRKRKQEQTLRKSSNNEELDSHKKDSGETDVGKYYSGENEQVNKRFKSILSDEKPFHDNVQLRTSEEEQEDSAPRTCRNEKDKEPDASSQLEYQSQVDETTDNDDEVDCIEYTRQLTLNRAIRMKRMTVLFQNMHQIQRELENEVMQMEQNH